MYKMTAERYPQNVVNWSTSEGRVNKTIQIRGLEEGQYDSKERFGERQQE